MTPIQQKFPSGRVTKLNGVLPFQSGVLLNTFLIGTAPGFLTRFLNAGMLRSNQQHAVVAPRLVQIPGRSQREANFGSAEAMQARKDGLVSTVATSWTQVSGSGLTDLTPMVQMIRSQLMHLPAAQRHAMICSAMASFPDVQSLQPDTASLTILVLERSDRGIRQRLASIGQLETVADHLLYDLVETSSLTGALRGELFIVRPDLQFGVRIDPVDSKTTGKVRLLTIISAADKIFAGQEISVDETESALSKPVADVPESPILSSTEFPEENQARAASEADMLANALNAAEKAEAPSPRLTAEERRTAERVERLREVQDATLYPTRSGKKVSFADLTRPQAPAPVTARRASGRFLDERVASPIFNGITLSYLESGAYDRDTASIFASLADDPVQPFYVENVERTDASDSLSLKETVTVSYRDSKGRGGNVRIDMPIVTRDGYMQLNGVKLHVTKQILANPIIKVRPDQVLITTAYNKATVERFGQNASPRSVYVRQLASWISKNHPRGIKVDLAPASASNAKFVSTIEYDDIAKTVRSIRTPSSALIFSRPALEKELKTGFAWASPALTSLESKGGHAVGWTADSVLGLQQNGTLVILKKDSTEFTNFGPDEGATIAEWAHAFVLAALPKDAQAGTEGEERPPTPSIPNRKFAYSRVKMLSQYLPTAVIVGYTLGLSPMLRRAEVPHRIIERGAYRRSKFSDSSDAIVFEDAVVLVEAHRLKDLLLTNGLKELDTEDRPIADFGPAGMGWVDHISDRLGSPGHAKGLVNFQASFIDPMTKELLMAEGLPTDMAGVLLYCNSLLDNNVFAEANDMANYRIRGPELINAILYKALHTEMQKVRMTRESATPQKLAIAQNEIIRQLVGASNVEEVKELNPLDEAEIRGKATWTGAAGGLGEGRTVTRSMRAFHPSMHGIFGYYSPDSVEVGVKRTLAYGAAVTDVRGRIDKNSKVDGATRSLALGELISPFSSTHSDPPKFWACYQ